MELTGPVIAVIVVSLAITVFAMTYDWISARYRARLIRRIQLAPPEQIAVWSDRRRRWIAHALEVERDAVEFHHEQAAAGEKADAARRIRLARLDEAAAKLAGAPATEPVHA
ncbi:hypothetical protein GCM10011374_35600 [Kocuria dechangensis]|uniref:Uncharacterized protein n=1 Tax=Kocuria dechangensis TaxID=1176249 RepID=A0A917H5W3_9MICC|nr:hypothetical protein [Kocuria dechangensis]GGG68157.1 hypothetical protein GCM10011374_35600 [Kocuria dechangensis]